MWTGHNFEVDIEFIRHGKCPMNEAKKYISFTDELLSNKGRMELLEKAMSGYYKENDLVFTSDKKRTIETAALIFDNIQPVLIENFGELSFGIFEGKSYEELKDNDDYKAWLDSGGTIKIPKGESREEFISRVDAAFKNILYLARDEESISIVCHGGTVMALMEKYTDLNYYDIMLGSGEKLGCHVSYEQKGETDVSISHLGITYRDNP